MLEVFLIALGLSADAVSVAISLGLNEKKSLLKNSLLMAVFFGGFQALMPFIGWISGNLFKQFIINFDHWLAFILLSAIGLKMIIESTKKEKPVLQSLTTSSLFLLAVATSIDALIIGISFSFLKINIVESMIIIGTTTLLLSLLGYLFGKKLSRYFGKRAKTSGGIVLILIGLKILLEHLF